MDAAECRRQVNSPDVFSVAGLEATLESLRAVRSCAADVVAEASRVPVPRPPLHRPSPSDDRYRLDLPASLIDEIVGDLALAEATAVSPEGVTTPEASRMADLVDRWSRHLLWLDGRAARGNRAP
jgi:hypothetical protein